MKTPALAKFPRARVQEEQQSALAYWGTGFACIAAMLAVCLFAGLRF